MVKIVADFEIRSKNVAQEMERVSKLAKQALSFDPQNKALQQMVNNLDKVYNSVNKTNDALKLEEQLTKAIADRNKAQKYLDIGQKEKSRLETAIAKKELAGKDATRESKQLADLEENLKSIQREKAEYDTVVDGIEAKLNTLKEKGAYVDTSLTFKDARVAASDLLSILQQVDQVSSDIISKNQKEPTISVYGSGESTGVSPLDEVKQSSQELRDEIQQIVADVNTLKTGGLSGDELSSAFEQMYDRVESAREKVEDLTDDLTIMRETANTTGLSDEEIDEFDASIRQTQIDLESMTGALDNLVVSEFPPIEIDTQTSNENITETNQELTDLQSKEEAVSETPVNVNVSKDSTEEASRELQLLLDNYRDAQQKMSAWKAGKIELNDDEVKQAMQDLAKSEQAFKDYYAKISEAANKSASFADISSRISNAIRNGASMIKDFGSSASKAFSKALSSLKSFGNSVTKVFKKAFSSVRSFARSLTSSLISPLKRMESTINKAFSMKGMKRGLTTLLKYTVGVRSLYFAFRKLRNMVKEGIENLVQFDSENNATNHAITELNSSLLYLKNAWASAFAPIINFVMPVLTALIDKMAETANAVARFIGNLTGQSVVLNAVKVSAQDYAESLKNTGSNAGGAADKVKKLTDRLAGFDDLNVLGKDNDDDGSGSGGGGGADAYVPDPNEMFQYVDSVSTLADMIKQAWEDADFSDLGEMLGQKIIAGLQTLNGKWGEIQEVARKIGASLGSFISGLFSDPQMFQEAGTALAEGLNTITYAIESFLNETKDINFGGGLADLINNFFAETDWDTVKENMITFAETLVTNINEFFGGLSTDDIGAGLTSLAEGITTSIATIISGTNWDEIISIIAPLGSAIMQGISDGLNQSDNPFLQSLGQMFDDFKTAFETGDISSVSSGITTFLVNAVGSVNWDEVIAAAGGLGDALLAGIQNSFANSDDPFLQSLGDLIANIRDTLATLLPVITPIVNVLLQVATAILPVISSLLQAISPIITAVTPILQVVADLITMLAPIISEIVTALTPIIEAILPVIQAVLESLKPVLEGFTTSILPVILEFISHLTPLISSIADLIIGVLNNSDGLSKVIMQFIGEILPVLLPLLNPIFDILTVIFDVLGELLPPLVALITPILQIAMECLQPLFDNFDIVAEIIETAIIPLLKILGVIVEVTIIPVLNGMVFVMNLVAQAINKLRDVMDVFKNAWKSAWDSVKDKINGVLNSMISGIEKFINAGIDGFNKLIGVINGLKFEIPDWVPELGGKEFGFSLNTFSHISLPRLAEGAVIPPNKEFMAILGDQSNGTNVEAPLDTIKQAVAEVVANNGNAEVVALLQQLIGVVESKNLVIGDKEIGKANARYVSQQNLRRGVSF